MRQSDKTGAGERAVAADGGAGEGWNMSARLGRLRATWWLLPLLAWLVCGTSLAAPRVRQVRLFVALCDNRTQGIAPVGEKIGNGDDPEANLYWGCSDGTGRWFAKSGKWVVSRLERDVSPVLLRRLTLRHVEGDVELVAEAYRGSALRECVRDFEAAAASGRHDLVAFIGHNGLMDFTMEPPTGAQGNATAVVVLCCLSERYFGDRLRAAGCRPLLTTQQLMYPGAFLLGAVIETWRRGGTPDEAREAAAAAYARNQKISVRSARGVFAPVNEENATRRP